MKNKRYGFVYITINSLNNMKYVGKCVYERKNGWKTYLGSGKYLVADIKRYGKDKFYKIIIDECDSEEELREVEEYYILQFNAVESDEFYNAKYASIGGDTFTHNPNKEHIRKLKSINSSGENNPMYGVKKNDYTIKRIKEANSKPIMIDNIEYKSMTEASDRLGIGISTISYRLNSEGFTNYIRL